MHFLFFYFYLFCGGTYKQAIKMEDDETREGGKKENLHNQLPNKRDLHGKAPFLVPS